jgi:hypothetical protein
MNYSQTQITNLALGRLGARNLITDINEPSPNAVRALAVWDPVFQEVLSERDWRFAKTRTVLQLSPWRPLYGYRFAWALPADLLRFVRPVKNGRGRRDFDWLWGPEGEGFYHRRDTPFWPADRPYVIETMNTGAWATWVNGAPPDPLPPAPTGRYALSDYGGFFGPAKICYIQLISDYTQLMPGFVNCLTNRLAQELAIPVTEDKAKFQAAAEMYQASLNSAEAQNECLDYSEDEAGSDSWERAGRRVWGL